MAHCWGKPGEHLFEFHVPLPLDFCSPDGGLLAAESYLFSLCLGLLAHLAWRRIGESLTGLDGRGVTGTVADHTIGPLPLQQQLVQMPADALTGEVSKGAGKRALARYMGCLLQVAYPSPLFVIVQPIH